ncbi:MAG: hypothetical protein AUJ85_07390 [Elusimicrobia bacterium CG1_02_37_114]|nr:MAG: hypothetical protein AUJ85_07390 [Elusimicrobia bacterium CG1_02_37_114]PIZ13114.1 MAG: hypothetical protein COY53_06590 [Elusimicrobia bacterium CG_4_10_14_0_8_um_filter_37_32]
MEQKKYFDSLVSTIERALNPGRFVPYGATWSFISDLEKVKEKIDDLVNNKQAEQSVSLYEIFLSGCYEKANEIDDSGGNLGMFFDELFCSWVSARQKAGFSPEETVHQILKWMDNDEYGFCYGIEKNLVGILNPKEMLLFKSTFKDRFDKDFLSTGSEKPKRIYDYPYSVRHNADILKVIYIAKKNIPSYVSLCEKIGISPRDCGNIATLYKDKLLFQDALTWIEKGLDLETKENWPNESICGLAKMKRELLTKLGQEKDALESAWDEFKRYPSEYAYDELIKYVPQNDSQCWHKKAIEEAKNKSLSGTMEICIKTKEWDILNECIISASHEQLEDITHSAIQKLAEVLVEKYPLSVAKVYRALGIQILKSKKSKYYEIALEHFQKAKKLYYKTDCEKEWLSLVEDIRKKHSRKYSFIEDFEKLVSGEYPEFTKSFVEKSREIWKKQVGG